MQSNKTVGWYLSALVVLIVAWWWLDPVSFYGNPVFTWIKGLSVPLPGSTH